MRMIWDAFLDGVERHFWTICRLNIAHALVAILWWLADATLRDIDAEQDKAIAACAVPYRRGK